jgi:hypothetical protein
MFLEISQKFLKPFYIVEYRHLTASKKTEGGGDYIHQLMEAGGRHMSCACVRVELVSLCKIQSKSDFINQSGKESRPVLSPNF